MGLKKCACGNNTLLILGQRVDWDILKFSGVVLRSDMIDRAISGIKNLIESEYRMHVYEETSDGVLKPKLILEITPLDAKDSSFLEQSGPDISRRLFLTAKKTLDNLTQEKIFLPLEIKVNLKTTRYYKSQKPIISHL
jgi:hypothetical protein